MGRYWVCGHPELQAGYQHAAALQAWLPLSRAPDRGGMQGCLLATQRTPPPRPAPTAAAAANFLLSTLSPIFSIAKVGGPTQVAPADSTALANTGFSLRKPGQGLEGGVDEAAAPPASWPHCPSCSLTLHLEAFLHW